MKVSLNWLRELVELPPTVPELVDLLTLAGVEVEGVETSGCSIANVVVAQINQSVQHPNADRLSVCQVDDGSGTARQIVCGAKNYKVGDKVPLALPGAKLGPDFTIKVGKLRGVESQGMLCAADELGMPKGADGLLILSPDAKPGTPIAELFSGDTILDLEITPNRPDLLCHLGIAREIGALTGKSLITPNRAKIEPTSETSLQVGVETTSPCYYSAVLLNGVKIGPSSETVRGKLEAIGLRAINNAVDATNYDMMYVGQPSHVFDAAKVSGTIRVRDAKDGEQFAALDGKTYQLTADDLVIADDHKVLALAGVMGGSESGVTESTTDIIAEIGWFEPIRIRRTSRRLGLFTDSSYRFERGVDLLLTCAQSTFTPRLLADVCQADVIRKKSSASSDDKMMHNAMQPRTVSLRPERVKALLGVEVSSERVEKIFGGLGLKRSGDAWEIPCYRSDLTREIDLIEEIARVIGMDAIPSKTQGRFAPASPTDRAYDRAMHLRRAFAGHGLHEARSLTLVPAEPRGLAFTQTEAKSLQRVKNPMIDDQVVLRPNLLHGLLTALTTNVRAGEKSIRLFEIGRVFSTQKPEEFSHAAIVLSGPVNERNWRQGEGRNADLFDLKGILESTIGATFAVDPNPALALSLSILVNEKPVGFAGQLWPADARAIDAAAPVVFADIDLGALDKAKSATTSGKYSEIQKYPAVIRDIALLAPLELHHESIRTTLNKANEPLLANVELFDVFTDSTGAKVAADKKSLAYSLTYRSAERTLTSDEVNAAHDRVKNKLKSELSVTLRE